MPAPTVTELCDHLTPSQMDVLYTMLDNSGTADEPGLFIMMQTITISKMRNSGQAARILSKGQIANYAVSTMQSHSPKIRAVMNPDRPDEPAITQPDCNGWKISWNPDDQRWYVAAPGNPPHVSFNARRNAMQYARTHLVK